MECAILPQHLPSDMESSAGKVVVAIIANISGAGCRDLPEKIAELFMNQKTARLQLGVGALYMSARYFGSKNVRS